MILDEDELKSRIFYGLKSLSSTNKCLNDDVLESSICYAFNLTHVGGSNFYADGIFKEIQVSIKSRKIDPKILKRGSNKDFQTDEKTFLSSLGIVQRRQKLDFDESSASAEKIGGETLRGFQRNIDESYGKFNTTKSYEIIVVHGYSCNSNMYIMSLYWQEYIPLNENDIQWVKKSTKVEGYITVNSVQKKVAERMNNGEYQATCFIEYKDLTKYKHSVHIKLPIPEMTFDKKQCLTEIKYLTRKNNDSNLFKF